MRRKSMSKTAGDWVRSQILSQAWSAGKLIRPEEVGQALGISTTPAREALQALNAEGFIDAQQGKGFLVEELTGDDIRDVFTAHAFIAGELAVRAVNRAEPEDIDELEALHFELMAAARRGHTENVEERNHQFHRKINQLADSTKLQQILGIVSRYVPRSFYAEVPGWVKASSDDHAAIITAFRNDDSSTARKAMSNHIQHAGELLASYFEGSSEDTAE